MKFIAVAKKELLLIFRDLHALLALFIMPILFISIMALSLKNTFLEKLDLNYKIALVNFHHLDKDFANVSHFTTLENAKKHIKNIDIIIEFNQKNYSINILSKPKISMQYLNMLKSKILLSFQEDILKRAFGEGFLQNQLKIKSSFIDKNGDKNSINSSNFSVPAWLIFSMFFILIPISNTFINEKNFGTFARLKSMNVSYFDLIAGKFLPYFLINNLQALLIFAFGVYMLPFLGLEALEIKGSILSLFICIFSISFCAICFGLLIANIAKSSEEATTIGGVSNIILASIGGIMVPSFVMPEIMQTISKFSPFNWALEALLDVLLKNGDFKDIYHYILYLISFGLFCFFSSLFFIKKTSG